MSADCSSKEGWYRIVHSLSLSAYNDQRELRTYGFFCPDDPDPPTFEAVVWSYGSSFLSAFVNVRDKSVKVRLTFKLYDKVGDLLVLKESPVLSLRPNLFKGVDQLFKISPGSRIAEWRLICVCEYRVESSTTQAGQSLSNSCLSSDYLQLLESAANSDVTFLVQGERIQAHKLVLSTRCQYFRRMFESNTQEGLINEVRVTDISPDVFRGLLRFLYSDALPKDFPEIALDLLVAADKYGVEKLKWICESDAPLNFDNVVEALHLAERLDSERLLTRAKKVFKTNCVALMQSDEMSSRLGNGGELTAWIWILVI